MATGSQTIDVNTSDIPVCLLERDQWVLWKSVIKKGERAKVPYQVDGTEAKSNDPSTWSSYADVLRRFELGDYDGVGYVFSEDDDFVGVDLDGCRDPGSGVIADWAEAVIDKLASYSEVSPSGSGVKIFVRGESPFSSGKNRKLDYPSMGCKKTGIEIYEKGRYFAVTGQRLDSPPATIEFRKLSWLRDQFWSKPAVASTLPPEHDGPRTKIIGRARAYVQKMDPAISGQKGHDQTFKAACKLVIDFALSKEEAWPIMVEFNQRCEPPWSEHDLNRKLDEALKQEGPRGGLLESGQASSNGRKPKASGASGEGASGFDDIPAIYLGTDEPRIVNEAVAAIGKDSFVYQRGGRLVHIVREPDPPKATVRRRGAPRAHTLALPTLRERLSASARWLEKNDEGTRVCHPPQWAAKAVDARGTWPEVRVLEAIVETPILRPDGSVFQKRGYDPATGLFLEPVGKVIEIPDHPSEEWARRARDTLLDLVVNFPFGDDRHRSGWLAAVLTLFARYAYDGPSPLFLIDGNAPGTGKGLLANTISGIALGRRMPVTAAPRTDDEWRKRITATALAADAMMLLDNVEGKLGCPSLNAALTATTWSDRVLGESRMVADVPLTTVWYATGNNVVLNTDTVRRTVHIRIECMEEQPETRSGFKYPALIEHITNNRAKYAAAALTLLAAYCAAGRPDTGIEPWGSFEGWSDLVRSTVVWAAMPDPAGTRADLASEADEEVAALRTLFAGLDEADPQHAGLTAREMIELGSDRDADLPALAEAVALLAGGRDGRANTRSFGMRLNHFRKKVLEGRYLDARARHRTKVWHLKDAE